MPVILRSGKIPTVQADFLDHRGGFLQSLFEIKDKSSVQMGNRSSCSCAISKSLDYGRMASSAHFLNKGADRGA